MAAKHNYGTQGPRSFYKPADPGKGSYRTVSSENEEQEAKNQGFTSLAYVRSEWPKTAYKKTGETRPVGKLENSNEQNMALVASLGPDWGLEHVATPEPVAPSAAKDNTGMDLTALLGIATDIALMKKRVEDLEEAAIQGDAIRAAQDQRIIELESIIEEPATK